ncbi:MAG: DUF4340 domain-containing protein [bacterium]
MNSAKGMKWLLIVLAAFAGIWAGLTLRDHLKARPQPLFPAFAPEAARTLKFEAGGNRAELSLEDGTWLVTSEDSLPAERQAVEDVLKAIAAFSKKDRISSNPQKRSQYQVDSSGVAVTVEGEAGKVLAAFVAGKMGPDFQSTYIRDAGSGDVVLAQGYLAPVFNRGSRSWQDRRIFRAEPKDITELGVAKPGGAFALRRSGDQWYAGSTGSTGSTGGPAGRAGASADSLKCDPAKVSRVARALAYLRCDDFAGRVAEPGWGLESPGSSVWFKTSAGEEHRLLVGNDSGDGRYYATRGEGGPVYLITAANAKTLLPDLAELLPGQAAEGGPSGASGAGAAGPP